MHLIPAVLALLAAIPVASAQSLVALTPCCPNTVVSLDPATGATTPIVAVGGATDLFIATVGSVAIDVAGSRAFLVRNGRIATADLTTGEVADGPAAFGLTQLAGFDAARDRLLGLSNRIETEGSGQVQVTSLIAYRPATQDTVHIARVGRMPVPLQPGQPFDAFSSVGGPAVADGQTLFTVRNFALLRVDLETGALDEQPLPVPLTELLGYDASTDALYRLDRQETVDGPTYTIVGRVVRVQGGTTDTLATVVRAQSFNNGPFTGDSYAASLGMAVYDAPNDRVVLRRNGVMLVVDLSTGAVAPRTAASAGVVGGALSRQGSVAAAPAPPPLLRPTVAPNPVLGPVRVEVGAHAHAQVDVFDALGRRVASLLDGPTGGAVRWDPAGLAPGVYRVRVVADGRVVSVPVTVAQ